MIFRSIEKLGDRALYIVEQWGMMGVFLFTAVVKALQPPYQFFPLPSRSISSVRVRPW